jgi:small subunit ribosomal protein S17
MLTKKGVITSAGKMKDTVTVTVHQLVAHPLYKKSFRKSKKFLADTSGMNDLIAGDEVIISECKPLSKRKHFLVKEVVKRAPRVSEMVEEAAIEQTIHREKIDTSHDSKPETSRPQS